jgi:hypothetical protein
MYGLYQLLADARWASKALSTLDLAAIGDTLRAHYRAFGGGASSTRPLVESLLTVTASNEIRIRGNDTSDLELRVSMAEPLKSERENHVAPGGKSAIVRDDAVLINEFSSLPPQELARAMCGWSDDSSAAIITEALGFEYLWAISRRSGLFRTSWPPLDPERANKRRSAGGLFLGLDFQHGQWTARPKDSAPVATSQMGTARSVAILMTQLLQYGLPAGVGELSEQMDEMLRHDNPTSGGVLWRGETSPLFEGFVAKPLGPAPAWTPPLSIVQPVIKWGTSPTEIIVNPPPLNTPLRRTSDDLVLSKLGLSKYKGQNCVCNALAIHTTRSDSDRPQPLKLVLVAVSTGEETQAYHSSRLMTFANAVQMLVRR